jgi:hypothetical protein
MSSRVNSEFWASVATGRDIRAPLPDFPDTPEFESFLRATGIRDPDVMRREAPRILAEFNRSQVNDFSRPFDDSDLPF